MHPHVVKFKTQARDYSNNSFNFVIYANCGGFVLSILLTVLILVANKKIN